MPSLVFKIAGIVAYADGSHGPFEASIHQENIADPFSAESLDNFAQLGTDMPEVVSDLLALLPGSVSFTYDTPATDKTVSDVVMNISGQIARDDNTHESFVIEYRDGALNHYPDETSEVWTDITGDSSFLAQVTDVLEAVGGDGNVTIT